MSFLSMKLYFRNLRASYTFLLITIFCFLIFSYAYFYSYTLFLITTTTYDNADIINNSLSDHNGLDIKLTLLDLLSYEKYKNIEWLSDSNVALNSVNDRRLICSDILDRNRKSLLESDSTAPDVSVLGIGGTIMLTSRLIQSYEYLNIFFKTLESLTLNNSYDILHLTGELQEFDKLDYESSQFLNKLGELGVVSISITIMEPETTVHSQSFRSILSEANDAGIKLTGIVLKRSPLEQTHRKMNIFESPQGIKIGYLAYCALRACYSPFHSSREYRPAIFSRTSVFEIQQMRANGAKLVVVSVSWSDEKYSVSPAQYAKVITHQLAMAGVSIVVGYHPRIRQGHGFYKNTFVIFSAGFIFSEGDYKNDSEDFFHMDRAGFDGERENNVFNFYQIRVSLRGDFIVRYRTVSKRTGGYVNDKTNEWIITCSDGDIYCVECIDLK